MAEQVILWVLDRETVLLVSKCMQSVQKKGIIVGAVGDLRSIAEGIALIRHLLFFGQLLGVGIAFGTSRERECVLAA